MFCNQGFLTARRHAEEHGKCLSGLLATILSLISSLLSSPSPAVHQTSFLLPSPWLHLIPTAKLPLTTSLVSPTIPLQRAQLSDKIYLSIRLLNLT